MNHDIYAPGAMPDAASGAKPVADRPADRAGAAPYDQVTASIYVPVAGPPMTASAEVSPINHVAMTPSTTVTEAACTLALKRIACKMYIGYQENEERRTAPMVPWDSLPTEVRANWCASAMAVFPKLNDA